MEFIELGYLGDLRIPAVIYQYGTDIRREEASRDSETIRYRVEMPPTRVAFDGRPWAVLTYPC